LPFAPTTRLPGASTSPPPVRDASIDPERIAHEADGQRDLVVERARQPGDGERLPPRVDRRDAAHHARVAQCLAQQLDEQCAYAAIRPPGS